ncbi:MAG: dTDP-4-amino-4,6-dideoxygalactose transaminase [Gemmatales bacterium]
MQPSIIPFNRSSTIGKEFQYIAETLLVGQIAGDQTFTKRCHQMLESGLGVSKALLTTSCTHALEMCALLLNIQPGDEVILPSFTFVSTANAFALRGAKIVFADVRPDTINLDETQLERLITKKTKAVVVVHYAGVACEMDAILEICRKHNVAVVEDNAHGFMGTYRGKKLGTLGTLATLSFHETKNFTCGEGGALLINDPALIERAEIIREKGTNRSRFFRGQVDKYTWVDVGSSYLISDVLAAFLFGQLERGEAIQTKRQQIWERYYLELGEWAKRNKVQLPHVPFGCGQAYHMFYLVLPSLEARQSLMAHLKAQNIVAVFHYQSLHVSDMGRTFGGKPSDCPVTERMSDCLLRLPFYNSMTEEEQTRVIRAVTEWK